MPKYDEQMTDEELIARLRMIHEWKLGRLAAERIEALAEEVAELRRHVTALPDSVFCAFANAVSAAEQNETTTARDVRAAALREAAAAIHPEIPRDEWTAQDEAEAELAGIILAMIDKEPQP